jgi:hypothetical protein
MFDDDHFTELMGEIALAALRWLSAMLLVGIFAEFLILGFH